VDIAWWLRRCGWTAAGVVLATAWASADDWPQWRGPARNGVSAEASGWPHGWPPERLWSANVGWGCTSPIMADGRLYVMGWSGSARRRPRGNPKGTDTVLCLDAATGKQLWKQSYPASYQGRHRTGDTNAYGGPSATPTLDTQTGLLYTLGVDGALRCWDTARNGRPVWRRNLYDEYRAPQRPNVGGGRRDYGYTSSPLVHGETIIVEVGAPSGTLRAFDRKTGKPRWRSKHQGPAGHTCGPVPMKVGGIDCVAVLTLTELLVVRVDAGHQGETFATRKYATDYACNLATPAVEGDRVAITSGYNHKRTTLLEAGAGRMRTGWTARDYALLSSPVIHAGRLYMVDAAVKCLDMATGKLMWRGGAFAHGSCIVTADHRLIVFGKGRLALLEAGATTGAYRELARLDKAVGGICYPHVALSDGVIACKDRDGRLACFGVGVRGGGR